MNTSTNVVRLRQPEEFEDPLTDILRSGARRLLAQAVELEAEAFLARMQDLKLPDGRDRLVRHGHGPERMIQTGIGPVAVSRVKIRDRGAASDGRPGPLLVVDPAQMGAPDAEPRRALADPLPSGGLDRRLPGGACGTPRPRRTELVAFSDRELVQRDRYRAASDDLYQVAAVLAEDTDKGTRTVRLLNEALLRFRDRLEMARPSERPMQMGLE